MRTLDLLTVMTTRNSFTLEGFLFTSCFRYGTESEGKMAKKLTGVMTLSYSIKKKKKNTFPLK